MLQAEIKKWAEETVKFYHDFATEKGCDLAYYTQSDLSIINENPDLVILGINPGSVGDYKELTPEEFLEGNPFYGEREKWKFWSVLKEILKAGKIENLMDNDQKLVFTNMIFFGTKKEYSIPAIVLEKCPEKTIELLKILNPKRILCLGKNNCFNRLIKEKKGLTEQISFGKLDEIPVYGIDHTSSCYSYEKRDWIGKCLAYLFENQDREVSSKELEEKFEKEFKAFKKRQERLKLSDLEVKNIAEKVENKLKELGFENYNEKETHRFSLPKEVQVTITHQENGYIAIRHKSFEGGNNYSKKEYPLQEEIAVLLEEKGFKNPYPDVWLGVKNFYLYGEQIEDKSQKIAEEVIECIIKDINELKVELENL